MLIVTCDRPRRLRRLLDDLAGQTLGRRRFEVVVSDDGSDPPAETVLAPFRRRLDLGLVRGPRRGPAAARNRALGRLRCEIAVLLNDDVRVEPDLLAAHLELQRRQRRPTAVMGTFEFPAELRADPFHRTIEDLGLIGTRAMNPGVPLGPEAFWTGNLSLPAAELRAVGGFDESFDEPKGDDVDLGYRLRAERGVRPVLSRRPRAWHHHPHTPGEWWQRSRMVGRALRRLADKHRDPLFWPGGARVQENDGEARAARRRLTAQGPAAARLIEWVERLAAGDAVRRTVRIPGLGTPFELPGDAEALLRAGLAAATWFLHQEAFWGFTPLSARRAA